MEAVTAGVLVRWLRAAGESSRLRLLMLSAERGLSVSDLAHVLNQSEPRVSRHLKILCEAGLMERLRQGQWVEYRLARGGAAASFVRGILAQADPRDPSLQHDRSAVRAVAAAPTPFASGAESRLGRALAAFVSLSQDHRSGGRALVVGAAHPELLESAARSFDQLTTLAPSRRAAQAAQALAARRGFKCRVVRAAGSTVSGAEDIAKVGTAFDAILLDHPALNGEALAHTLAQVRRIVAPAGQVWVFEPYEALETSRERIVEHPLARLRRLLQAADLACERLSPIEADGEHVLAAQARAAEAAPAAQGARS